MTDSPRVVCVSIKRLQRHPKVVKCAQFAEPFVTKSDENEKLLAVHCRRRLLQRLRTQPGFVPKYIVNLLLLWIVPFRVCVLNYGFASVGPLVW